MPAKLSVSVCQARSVAGRRTRGDAPAVTCAGDNTLAALIAGAVDGTAARRLEHHLDSCESCRRLVADLGRGLSALDHGDQLPRAGDLVGRYAIKRAIGVGGMGVVYEARDTTLDRRVAVKVLRPDSACEPRVLLAEARAMARLSHRNICAIHDVGTTAGRVYLCMEYIAGTTLRDWLAETPRSAREVIGTFADAGRGLAYIHGEGLVHLDFKPDNVLVERGGRVVVTDFGVAGMMAERAIAGTPRYMAPEQRRGKADARADQFAFCIALGDALGDDAPSWARRVIDRGTQPRPDDRFASMAELLAALAAGTSRLRRRISAAAVIAAAIALTFGVSRAPRTVTRLVDRPVVERIIERVPFLEAAAELATTPESAAVAPRSETRTIASAGLAHALALVIAHDHRDALYASSFGVLGSIDGHATVRDDASPCDDGTERTCTVEPPWCPAGSTLAVQDGCWTCAEAKSCSPLGMPRSCDDGSPLRCSRARPTCGGRELPSIRGGCWECADPFTCGALSASLPVPAPFPNRCGNGACDPGEDHASCASDCAAPNTGSGTGSGTGHGSGSGNGSGWGSGWGSGSGSGLGWGAGSGSGAGSAACGNGFCEVGEDHASCASDCCELTGSGGCVAICGDLMCEVGEDHASCPSDCCQLSAQGTCL